MDRKGVTCPYCRGGCSIGNVNCKECDAQGKIYPDSKDFDEIDDEDECRDIIQFIYNSKENPLSPNEFFEQSSIYCAAYKFLVPYLFGEFDDRLEELNASKDNANRDGAKG